MELKEKLKKLRTERNISQQALADAIFVSRSAVAKWEAGLGIPCDDTMEALEKFFDVEKGYFLTDEPEEVIVKKNINLRRTTLFFRIITIILTSLILISIIAVVLAFTPKAFLKNVSAEDVESISVFNGSSGKSFVIEDSGEIEFIVNNIQSTQWHRSGISSFHDGYSFDLSFVDKEGRAIDSFIINNSYLVRDDPFFYNQTNTPVCYNYLQALEAKYTELPQRPENTTLEFWITENVSNLDLSKYQVAYKPGAWGYENKIILGSGYTSTLDSAGNEIKPEHYVIYEIAPYPNNATSGEYITAIEITDPSVYLYGLTVDCTADEFNQTFEQLGFIIENHDESDRKIERYAIKDGIVIVYSKHLSKTVFGIVPETTIRDMW